MRLTDAISLRSRRRKLRLFLDELQPTAETTVLDVGADELAFGEGDGCTTLNFFEELYPWPELEIAELLRAFPGAERVVWAQEEPANMGGWTFVRERLSDALLPSQKLAYAGRRASASPAAGSMRVHREEQAALVATAFDGLE